MTCHQIRQPRIKERISRYAHVPGMNHTMKQKPAGDRSGDQRPPNEPQPRSRLLHSWAPPSTWRTRTVPPSTLPNIAGAFSKCLRRVCKEDILTADICMKKGSASLVTREMPIRTTARSHAAPARLAVIRKTANKGCRPGGGEEGPLVHCRWEWELVPPLWKAAWRILQRLEMDLPYDPEIALLGI